MGMDLRELAKRTIEETFGKGSPETFVERAELSFVGHDPIAGTLSLGDAKALAGDFKKGFPDLRCAIHSVVTEGDKVACHWKISGTHKGDFRGFGPSGKRVEFEGITLFRFHGNRVAEQWTQYDALKMLRQLGALPSMSQLADRYASKWESWEERA